MPWEPSDGLILTLLALVLLFVYLLLRQFTGRKPPTQRKPPAQGRPSVRREPLPEYKRPPVRPKPHVRRKRTPENRPYAVVDGSNVMHWRDNTPDLGTVIATVDILQARGYRTGVIFDANAGYKLTNRYQDDAQLAYLLGLPATDVFVVPKGQQADPFLLDFASNSDAIVVSNDRFRDRIADYPALSAPGRLIRGGWQDGKVNLTLPEA